MKRLALTVLAPDRPGIVKELSTAIADAGGNWLESRMAALAGQFAGILLVEVPAGGAEPLAASLRALPGLTVTVQEADPVGAPAVGDVTLTVLGTDRPGIVRRITSVLAGAGINVETLATERRDAPVAGGQLFEARATLSVPASVLVDPVHEQLEAIADDLMVTWEGLDRSWKSGGGRQH